MLIVTPYFAVADFQRILATFENLRELAVENFGRTRRRVRPHDVSHTSADADQSIMEGILRSWAPSTPTRSLSISVLSGVVRSVDTSGFSDVVGLVDCLASSIEETCYGVFTFLVVEHCIHIRRTLFR